MNAFFYSNSNLKSIEKLIFAAFGKILVLVNAFFYSSSTLKSFEITFIKVNGGLSPPKSSPVGM